MLLNLPIILFGNSFFHHLLFPKLFQHILFVPISSCWLNGECVIYITQMITMFWNKLHVQFSLSCLLTYSDYLSSLRFNMFISHLTYICHSAAMSCYYGITSNTLNISQSFQVTAWHQCMIIRHRLEDFKISRF